jgi:phosphate:Na+ symporter
MHNGRCCDDRPWLALRPRATGKHALETTSLHLNVLRDLKRIHSHICSVAYPVLEAAG